MERATRLTTLFLLALIAAAIWISTAAASTGVTKARHHHLQRHAVCVVHGRRHGAQHRAAPARQLRRCVRRARKHRARIALTGSSSGSQSAGASLQGPLHVGLDASIVGWSDMTGRLGDVVSQTGAKWMRQDFFWNQIEPSPGVFDFSHYDQYVLLSAQHGVHLLPLMFDTPSWAGATDSTIPADPSGYAGYVAAVIHRYGPHGSFWTQHPDLANYAIQTFELWNEPYYDNGNGGNYDPARYAHLVKAAAIAGRAADPTAKFLIAAENQSQHVGANWVWWVDALYQAVPDLNNYFDGVAVHPYGVNLTQMTMPTKGLAYDGYQQIRRVEAIRREFVNHNASNKPLWITEVGWPTCSSGSVRCTTPAGQAANLKTVFEYAHTTWKPYLQGLFVYSYDDSRANSTDPESNYGLAYNDGTPKPALSVFKANES